MLIKNIIEFACMIISGGIVISFLAGVFILYGLAILCILDEIFNKK